MPRAKHFTICDRCDQPIQINARYVIRKGKAIHPDCAPGSDDE